jgi:hypothetical protein
LQFVVLLTALAGQQIRLGTVEKNEASDEFTLRPYMNTPRSRRLLGREVVDVHCSTTFFFWFFVTVVLS